MKDNRTSTFLVLGLALLLAACSPPSAAQTLAAPTQPVPTPSATAVGPPPVIIDSDMGSNGIMALLYFLQRPEFTVRAVTVAGTGEAHCGPGTADALGAIALTGSGDISVACGRSKPLKGDHEFPDFVRERADGPKGITWPDGGAVSVLTAPEVIQSIVSTATQPVVIITDGPLTNLAEVFLSDPGLAENIKMIYIMGGAIDVPGNIFGVPLYAVEQTAEFNIFVDPYAANVVLDSGAPITLVPLDVTNQVPLNQVFYNILSASQVSTAAKAVYDMLTYTKQYQEYGIYFWDPLTYAIASDESLATYTARKITVIEEGAEIGRTKVVDGGHEVRVAMTTNPDRFVEQYVRTLNGGKDIRIDWAAARATPTPPPNTLTLTVSGGKCELSGSLQISSAEFGVYLVNQDQFKRVGMAIVTLDEGKTLADLIALTRPDKPTWAQLLSFDSADPGKSLLRITKVEHKPIYLVCFDDPPPQKLNAFGPIEVIK